MPTTMRTTPRFFAILAVLAFLAGIFSLQAQQPRPAVFVAIYERGSSWDASKTPFQQVGIQDHIAYVRTNLPKFIGASPFAPTPDDPIVGMIILSAASKEEAQALIDADPAIQSKLMKTNLRRWHVEGLKGCF